MLYIIATLGCKVNQVETQAMEEMLHAHGHRRAQMGEKADAVIVNSCAVTAESGRKTRQMIRRLHDENPGAVVAVSGCYSQLEPEKVKELGAAVVFGAADRGKFVEAIERAVEAGEERMWIDRPFERRVFEELRAGAVEGRTRAMLKIQDGCHNFCSYCIIPYTRGRLRSLPLEAAADESARLAAEGFREIVLTGIEVASYGVDLPGQPGLADVIEAVAAVSGEMRIRLGSLEPTVITEEFCEKTAALKKLCPHFHLSLQSGCDRTLRAMRRKYNTEEFFAVTERLRKYFPGCALTGDLITGFPGETEEDHAETLRFIEKCRFAALHVFPYSRRPGTKADAMPGQLTAAVKSRRAAEAQAVADAMRKRYLQENLGAELEVLFESGTGEGSAGHSGNYLTVRVPETGLAGQVKTVKITGVSGQELVGIPI
ncbi:MAG: tRNA (N(6)-L-threonylcarbamoyladenosine(37)-C(2))-methylthiotransferase MtaB [Oscillospiraceae bacterium]|nr:tRNA (N(6)-L-threonylcarbamoyladenosine(37)-C(2))-methylthiotransferase MtaB [Oscillospiraceae bacterium]